MLPDDAVTDPTDWIGTPLSSLSTLEAALQCHVCKELFNTPMITSCSHTFCSLCIRRYLSQKGRCPACRRDDQESKLRKNWAMAECVRVYQEQRAGLLALARRIARESGSASTEDSRLEGRPTKRRRIQPTNGTNLASEMAVRATRSQSRMVLQSSQRSREPSAVPDSEDDSSQYVEDDLSTQPGQLSPKPDDGLVACPMCNKRMKEDAVFSHLDQCKGEDQYSATQQGSNRARRPPKSVAYSEPLSTQARQRLGALNYSMLTETALRKKLAEISIPSHGSKVLMEKRHMEWMSLWNSSCDSSHPKTKRELLRELDVWERTQGRQIAHAQGPSGVMAKDFDVESWTKSNKDDFSDLIRKARAKPRVPTQIGPEANKGRETQGQTTGLGLDANDAHQGAHNGIVDLTAPVESPLQRQHSQGSSLGKVTV